jgi:hypothetical protein
MLLTLRTTNTHGDARSTADSVISALTPAAWYRNATGVTSAGGFASQWDDYSGNTRNLVQATATNQPAYANGVFTFDGVDNFMAASTWSQTQPETIYLVLNQATWTSGDFFCDGSAAATAVMYQTGVTPSVSIFAGTAAAANTNATVGAFHILCAVFNGASSSLKVDATAKTTGGAGAGNMGGFTLGSYAGGTTAYSRIDVKEGVVFSGAHDDATQSSVITALNNALTVF